jgi:phosphate regulon transcriptional regulator PhoB
MEAAKICCQRGKMRTVLIVDDERDILDLIAFNLRQDGFSVLTADNGLTAMDIMAKEHPDLVILDWMMPSMDGLEVCRRLRKNPETSRLPVIMLTAKSDTMDKVVGLEIGADDYLTKPFHIRELLARIHSLLRRVDQPQENEGRKIMRFRDIAVDLNTYRVTVGDRLLELTSREIKLLAFLITRPGRVYTRDELLNYVWGDESFVEPRTVDVHISRLRSLIEPDKENPRYILTVRGIGYKTADP